MAPSAVDFVYDVVCPYAYLASRRVASVASRLSCTVRWRPVLLGGVFRTIGAPPDPNTVMAAPRAAYVRRDLLRSAELRGVPLTMPADHPRRTVEAMRLCTAAPDSIRPALSHAVFAAYWEHSRDVADRSVLAQIAARFGLDIALIDEPSTKDGLRRHTQEAVDAGVFGVPSFVVDGRVYWGADRIELMVAAAGGTASPDRAGHDHRARTKAKASLTVEFFHDFASPFSYLAAEAIGDVVARHGVALRWSPILVGALFRAIGTADVPLFEMPEAKRAYVRTDLEDWARARDIAFRFPTHFPIRSVLPLRVAVHDPATTPAIYRAAWAEDRRIDDPEALHAIIEGAGLQPGPRLAAASDPAVKLALRNNTERAQSLGACGVPTIVVYDESRPQPLLLWGQDRLAMLDAVLGGWWPRGE